MSDSVTVVGVGFGTGFTQKIDTPHSVKRRTGDLAGVKSSIFIFPAADGGFFVDTEIPGKESVPTVVPLAVTVEDPGVGVSVVIRRSESVIIISVKRHGFADAGQIVETGGGFGTVPRLLQRRQQHGGKNGNNCNYDQ